MTYSPDPTDIKIPKILQKDARIAVPVVTGFAALIREYYPRYTAVQVRGDRYAFSGKTKSPRSNQRRERNKKAWMIDICVSGRCRCLQRLETGCNMQII